MTGDKDEEQGYRENVYDVEKISQSYSQNASVKGQEWSLWQVTRAQELPQNWVSIAEAGSRV